MEKNSIDILTIIKKSEIRGKGLMYVKSIVYEYLTEETDISKWDDCLDTLNTFGYLMTN